MTPLQKFLEPRGSVYKMSQKLNISQPTITNWKREGYIPLSKDLHTVSNYTGLNIIDLIPPRGQ